MLFGFHVLCFIDNNVNFMKVSENNHRLSLSAWRRPSLNLTYSMMEDRCLGATTKDINAVFNNCHFSSGTEQNRTIVFCWCKFSCRYFYRFCVMMVRLWAALWLSGSSLQLREPVFTATCAWPHLAAN